jgi:hypothetical protein
MDPKTSFSVFKSFKRCSMPLVVSGSRWRAPKRERRQIAHEIRERKPL